MVNGFGLGKSYDEAQFDCQSKQVLYFAPRFFFLQDRGKPDMMVTD